MSLIGRIRGLSVGSRWTCIGLLVLAITFAAWLSLSAFQAKSNLEQARSSAEQSKDALLSGNSEEATRWAEDSKSQVQRARSATHSLPWNIVSAVPLLGSPLKSTQQISDVVAGLVDHVLIPATKAGFAISPDKLVDGTRLDLNLLRSEEQRLSELSAAATKVDAQAQTITRPAYLSMIGEARLQLQDQTSKLASLLGNTALTARLAPSMLGADGPRTYLMAFQSNAEARGTGGLLGGFGIVRFDDGVPTVDTLGKNTELKKASASVDLGPEFNRVYGWMNPFTGFRNSNLSPHFPYAAQIWKSMWEEQTGAALDGVIAIDPTALSYVLGAIGPVTLSDGEAINAENVVELTGSTAYVRFPVDQAARKKYLLDIANAVVQKLAGPIGSPRKLLEALGRAVGEQRIAVWSSNPADQLLLEETPLAHIVPDDDAPYAQVIINNLAGNKMDYYLNREIEYAADGCGGDTRNSTIVVRLTNTATDKPLPDYVSGTMGLGQDRGVPWQRATRTLLNAPRGTMLSSVRLLATKGSKLLSVTSSGERVSAFTRVENGRPSFEVQVAIPPGKSGELTFRLTEPTSSGEPRVPVQPLIDHPTPQISVPTCP